MQPTQSTAERSGTPFSDGAELDFHRGSENIMPSSEYYSPERKARDEVREALGSIATTEQPQPQPQVEQLDPQSPEFTAYFEKGIREIGEYLASVRDAEISISQERAETQN